MGRGGGAGGVVRSNDDCPGSTADPSGLDLSGRGDLARAGFLTDTKRLGLNRLPDVMVREPPLSAPERDALRVVRRLGLVRPTELEERGIPRAVLYRLVRKGRLVRQARGLYVHSEHPYTAEHVLAQVAMRVPAGVLCLLTALRFHDLTTQAPSEVWITLPETARKPKLDYPRLAIARASGLALTEGIEVHRVEKVAIRVYSAAKTVADCFKYRNKIGIDVAVEALRDYSRKHRSGVDELVKFARICRVSRVMQPYLDSIA